MYGANLAMWRRMALIECHLLKRGTGLTTHMTAPRRDFVCRNSIHSPVAVSSYEKMIHFFLYTHKNVSISIHIHPHEKQKKKLGQIKKTNLIKKTKKKYNNHNRESVKV